jgi:MFS family permease
MQNQNKDYKWNFTVNLLDGASFWIGSSFISSTTILPLFISKLTSSLLPIGLISVITAAGWFLPQLFSARITESRSKMKEIVVGWGLYLERLPILVMILSPIIAKSNPKFALTLLILCLIWHTVGAGVVATAWMTLLAKIFSPERRGSFLGTTMFVGNGMGILGSVVSAWLLNTLVYPTSFILHFSIAALFIFLSWVFLGLTREPVTRQEVPVQDFQTYFASLIAIFKTDHNFRRFIITSVIITIGAMGSGFFTISAIRRFNVPDSTVGLYTLSMLIGQTLGNLALGWMADKHGHKQSIEIGVLAIFFSFLISVFTTSPEFYFIIFFLFGVNLSSGIVSGMLVVWEFCSISRVPSYSGLANTAKGMVGLVVPILATQVAKVEYKLLFGLCALISLLGLILLNRWVLEPRWTNINEK